MTGYEKRTRAQGAAAVVGVDAGKFEHAMVVRARGGRDTKPLTFRTSREGFEKAVAAILEAAGPGATPPHVLVGIEFAGTYGFTFAHFLHQLGFPVVSVLPAHTKKWKEVVHNQNLKTDAKDAVGITDLVAQGHFVSFPFLDSVYADLRYLVSTRERLSLLRRGAITG
jgi:transposase